MSFTATCHCDSKVKFLNEDDARRINAPWQHFKLVLSSLTLCFQSVSVSVFL